MGALRAVRLQEGEASSGSGRLDEEEAEALLGSRRADLAIIVPAGFLRGHPGPSRGEDRSTRFPSGAGEIRPTPTTYGCGVGRHDRHGIRGVRLGLRSPAILSPETCPGPTSLTEFELYVPGLLILALMMLMFTAAGALIREKDKGTLVRLRLSTSRSSSGSRP